MAEVLWTLLFIGAGLLWVGLVYAGLSSYVSGREDRRWPVWKVLLRGGHEQDEAAISLSRGMPLSGENCECRPASEGS